MNHFHLMTCHLKLDVFFAEDKTFLATPPPNIFATTLQHFLPPQPKCFTTSPSNFCFRSPIPIFCYLPPTFFLELVFGTLTPKLFSNPILQNYFAIPSQNVFATHTKNTAGLSLCNYHFDNSI